MTVKNTRDTVQGSIRRLERTRRGGGSASQTIGQPSSPISVGTRLLAYQRLFANSANGNYVSTSAKTATITVTGTSQGTGLWLVNFPVTPGKLLKFSWQCWAAGPYEMNQEWYFDYYVSLNGAAYNPVAQTRHIPTTAATPSPQGAALYVVPANTATMSLGLNVKKTMTMAGNGTLYLWNTAAGAFEYSWLTVEEIGNA